MLSLRRNESHSVETYNTLPIVPVRLCLSTLSDCAQLYGRINLRCEGSNMGYLEGWATSAFASTAGFVDASKSMSSWSFMKNLETFESQTNSWGQYWARLTAVANHLPPPSWNQLRWPPHEVVQSTVYGFCWNSPYGIASAAEICLSQLIQFTFVGIVLPDHLSH